MIRAVYDTNIVISGLFWSGAPRRAIQLARQGKVHLLISEEMLDELRDVIARPKFQPHYRAVDTSAEQLISDYLQFAEVIEPIPIDAVIMADPDDDVVLACAVSGRADFIVSGDQHLLDLGIYEGIAIVDVNDFLHQFT